MDLLLKGGVLHDPENGWEGPAEVLIRGNKIEAVSLSLGPVDVPFWDLQGKIILPGLVDMHVHLREPGNEGKETIATGCAAAVAGGVTSIACMPNTDPPADNKEIICYIKERAKRADLAKVYPIGAITRGIKGKEIAPMWEMAQEGAKGFSDDGNPVSDSGVMLRAMQYALNLGLPVISHCEDLSLAAGGVVHAGNHGYRLGLPVISPASEAVMVARDLLLQKEIKGKLHLAHLSAKESVELLRWAKGAGISVSAEATPHHLLLTEEAVGNFKTEAKMNPPLRTSADREALQRALKEGFIGVIATDHAPHRLQEKEDDFLSAPFGVIGLETAFPLLWTKMVEEGLLTVSELVDRFSSAPARLLDIPAGSLKPGAPADIVVVDPQAEQVVSGERFFSRSRNTPFEGWRLKGYPVMTMVDGDIKMWQGKVKGFSEDFPEIKSILQTRR